jgi:hypothetical protein
VNYLNQISSLDRFIPDSIVAQYPEFTELFRQYILFIKSTSASDVISRLDLDNISDQFIYNIKNEIAFDIPTANPIKTLSKDEVANLLLTATNLYKSKGTIHSIKYLFRVLYGSETLVELGRLGEYIEYKPTALSIVEIDSSGIRVSSPDYNLFSYQQFYKVGKTHSVSAPYLIDSFEAVYSGSCVTYFNDGTDKLWVEMTADIAIGDILMFPDIGRRVVVLDFNGLNLDGWNAKTERWRDHDGFYILNEINPRINITFYREVNGFNIIEPVDVDNTRYTFINGVLKFRNLSGVSYEFAKISVCRTVNSVQYCTSIWYTIVDGVLVSLTENNNDLLPLYSSTGAIIDATRFYDINGNQLVTSAQLESTKQLISMFSIYFMNNVRPDIYMDTVRKTVVPAGYKTIHIDSKPVFVRYSGEFYVIPQETNKIKYESIVRSNTYVTLNQLLSKIDDLDNIHYYKGMLPIIDNFNILADYNNNFNVDKSFYLSLANTVDYVVTVFYDGSKTYNGIVKYNSGAHRLV